MPQIPWNKGIKTGINPWKNGYRENYIPWNKGKKGIYSSKTRMEMGLMNKGKHHSEEWKRQATERMKGNKNSLGYKPTREHIRKALRRNPMSSLEKKFESIVQQFNFPYIFVGNGKFFIERKCPDFINTNGEKIAIEVYYKKHKDLFAGGTEKWKQDRTEIFSKYGWKIEFFDAVEVNEKTIFERLGGGLILQQ